MSFAYDVKKELCSLPIVDYSYVKAEYYGMLLFCKKFTDKEIIFTTEHKLVAHRFANFSNMLYSPIIERRVGLNARRGENVLNTLTFIEQDKCSQIFEDMGHNSKEISIRLNRGNIDCENATADFIRGVFLSCGSVTDPQKNYHLEFNISHKRLCEDFCKLLSEIDEFIVRPRIISRNGIYVAYIKDSEEITDLLTYMGATNCAMNIIGTKAMKQLRNNVNRIANSEYANLSKIANASSKQIKAIIGIDNKVGLETLPSELYEVAKIRLEYPEMSLRDIGMELSPNISRSGVNHRITKILDIAKNLGVLEE